VERRRGRRDRLMSERSERIDNTARLISPPTKEDS
jgi:hypothetical protein